jgi:hypothetical protein
MPTSTRPIADIARELGLAPDAWLPYGRDKAKVLLPALHARRGRPDGKLVVSAITPTPAGDGKTTMTIGLGQALWRVGARPVIALREPSIGPTLGMKGGGTGGPPAPTAPTRIRLRPTWRQRAGSRAWRRRCTANAWSSGFLLAGSSLVLRQKPFLRSPLFLSSSLDCQSRRI